jgi:hypothetical protein
MKTNAERFDRGKWWFKSKESKAFFLRRNGLVKSNGNELKEVIHITPSSSKNDQLKGSRPGNNASMLRKLINLPCVFFLILRFNSATRTNH